jgi:hypothetical protein
MHFEEKSLLRENSDVITELENPSRGTYVPNGNGVICMEFSKKPDFLFGGNMDFRRQWVLESFILPSAANNTSFTQEPARQPGHLHMWKKCQSIGNKTFLGSFSKF